ncbi:MAG: carboxypeptidase regulatory-like domain-containing protein, partial [Acidobacteriota bacterium]
MRKIVSAIVAVSLLIVVVYAQQAPSGTVRGTVTDPSKSVLANATITAKNRSTGAERVVTTGTDGTFLIGNLIPGEYELRIVMTGFKTVVVAVTVQIGETLTLDTPLEIGQTTETVVVSSDAVTAINTTDFKIDGVISRKKVDGLPLNGRNFLQLASLEPGVKVSTGNPGEYNNLFNVSIGGGESSLTRLTVDGANIVDPVNGSAGQNFSVESVQEFQISSFNFDLSTGVTSVGAVNIVSRTGGNEYHGTAFAFYRDNHMAAYPTLNRIASNPNPFFRRLQAGFALGGPIIKDKLVFFTNVERLNQTSNYSTIHTGSPVFRQFDAISSSPYKGWLTNGRLDYTINSKNTAFLRFSSDDNSVVAPETQN